VFPCRTILHPTDFSEHSQHAFRLACSLAREQGCSVTVLHVPEPPPFVSYGEMERSFQQPHGYKQELEEKLRQLKPPDTTVAADYRLEEGDPATEILHLAEELDCDLIVMGTHGRTGLGRLLMGSVAEKVLRKAPCPVITVKCPADAVQTSSG
jgi:nucleotide-binding universal stress UspA family protein